MALPLLKKDEHPAVHLQNGGGEEDYFRHQKTWENIFVPLSIAARRKMADLFVSSLNPTEVTSVLDVGVTTNAREDSNFFEKWYPHPHRLTCVGLDSAERVGALFPDLKYIQIAPGPLPFGDHTFDIGVSSAVIEHVGNREAQREHVHELLRVCRSVFITTPNRWFPIDPHTMLPFLHYLPPPAWRKLLVRLGREFYAREQNLNPLSARNLRSLFPGRAQTQINAIRLAGLPTNLVAVAHSPRTRTTS